ncbi:MAG TPA: hypothetical protein VIU62_01875 [Chloroflexota bacterium]
MRHIADGMLRRMQDEPQAVASIARQHLASCHACRMRLEQIAADAQLVGALLGYGNPAPDTARAFQRMQQRLAADVVSRPSSIQERITGMINQQSGKLLKPLGGIAAGLSLAAALALTPAGAWAGNFLTVFEPTQVTAVPIDMRDLQSLPDLAKYGTIHAPAKAASQHFTLGSAAVAAAGLPLLTPKALPSGVPVTATYEVVPGATGSFTFSAAKAQANAAAQGKTLPPMPANLDGATLQVSTGTALVEAYADPSKLKAVAGDNATSTTGTADASQNAAAAVHAIGPVLIIGEMKAPSVTMTGNGVTAVQLETYLLAQPGISPSLVSAIKALGDPTSTLPIPIPINKAVSQNVTLSDGTKAVVVGDSTGIIGGIIWEKNGIVYGIGGSLTESQLISMANGFVS